VNNFLCFLVLRVKAWRGLSLLYFTSVMQATMYAQCTHTYSYIGLSTRLSYVIKKSSNIQINKVVNSSERTLYTTMFIWIPNIIYTVFYVYIQNKNTLYTLCTFNNIIIIEHRAPHLAILIGHILVLDWYIYTYYIIVVVIIVLL